MKLYKLCFFPDVILNCLICSANEKSINRHRNILHVFKLMLGKETWNKRHDAKETWNMKIRFPLTKIGSFIRQLCVGKL